MILGSCLGILNLGFRQHLVSEIGAQETPGVEVHLPAKDLGKLCFHGKERQARHVTGLELHQDIDVALGPEVVPQDRTEEGQLADMATSTELLDLLAVDGYPDRHVILSRS